MDPVKGKSWNNSAGLQSNRASNGMDGVLLVDKPEGWTSFDVVAKVRGIINSETGRKIKIGHTGTLDPAATGLLVLVLGSYTKRAAEFSKLDKVYDAEITLGATSTTGDKEGGITQISTNKPSLEQIEQVLSQFLGKIQQVPHKYSAIKVDGKRAYKSARAGQEVKLEPREVTIYEITGVKYKYPLLKFTAKVSSGTYIRSLAEDIGEQLGTGAYLSALRRTFVNGFRLAEAIRIEELDSEMVRTHLIEGLPKELKSDRMEPN